MAYRNGPKIVTDGLVLYYDTGISKSYSGSGSSIYDLSTSKINSTSNNNFTYSSDNYGHILLDTTDERVHIPSYPVSETNGAQNGTINIWIYFNDHNKLTTQNAQIYMIPCANSLFVYFYRNAHWSSYGLSNFLYYRKTDGSTGYFIPNASYYPNQWYCNTFTWSEDGIQRHYRNGVMIFDNDRSGDNFDYWYGPTCGFHINTNYTIDGKFAQLQIYDRALSPEEVLQNFKANQGRFLFPFKGSESNPATHSSEILAENPNSPDGVYWFNLGYETFPMYCDMTNGGWMMVASNNARIAVIPAGTSRNNADYRLDRNGNTWTGIPTPDSDFIIGRSIQNLNFSSVRIYGFGRGSIDGTKTWDGDQGNTITATWNLSTTGDSRFTEIVPVANVTFGGNTTRHANVAYMVLDAVRNDISFNANSNQSTVGAAGVYSSNGDPSNGTYLGHGSTEGSYEGWYVSGGSHADSQGYTTWVK